MRQRIKALLGRRAGLPVACYLAAALLWLAYGLGCWAGDLAARAQGRLQPVTLGIEEFQLVDLAPWGEGGDNFYITTSGDPQLLWQNTEGLVVRNLRFSVEYLQNEPREMCLYYTTSPEEPYSADRRVFPVEQPNGDYLYTLPRAQIYSLRIDPCSPDESGPVVFMLPGNSVELNVGAFSLGAYLCPSWYQGFCLALYPALAAAMLDWLRAAARALPRPARKPGQK